jgi:hypothetical protein
MHTCLLRASRVTLSRPSRSSAGEPGRSPVGSRLSTQGSAAAKVVALTVVNVQTVDTHLAVESSHHVCYASREIGSCQPFHHCPFPLVSNAVYLEQVASAVLTYAARTMGRTESAVLG